MLSSMTVIIKSLNGDIRQVSCRGLSVASVTWRAGVCQTTRRNGTSTKVLTNFILEAAGKKCGL